MKLLDRIPAGLLAVAALFMCLAPFYPQPHIVEKLTMLYQGSLVKPVDIFDLLWHSLFPVLLALKLVRMQQLAKTPNK